MKYAVACQGTCSVEQCGLMVLMSIVLSRPHLVLRLEIVLFGVGLFVGFGFFFFWFLQMFTEVSVFVFVLAAVGLYFRVVAWSYL